MSFKKIKTILEASYSVDDGMRLKDEMIPEYEFTISNYENREIVVFKNLDGSFITQLARDTFKEISLNKIIGLVHKLQNELKKSMRKETSNKVFEVVKQIDDDCPFGKSISYDDIENKPIDRKSCDVDITKLKNFLIDSFEAFRENKPLCSKVFEFNGVEVEVRFTNSKDGSYTFMNATFLNIRIDDFDNYGILKEKQYRYINRKLNQYNSGINGWDKQYGPKTALDFVSDDLKLLIEAACKHKGEL